MESISQLGLGFFGLTLTSAKTNQLKLYKQIHQICFHGKGGYDWNTVYNLPIYLRNFIFFEIKKHYDEENAESENAKNPDVQVVHPGSNSKPAKKVTPPNFKSSLSPIKYS